MSRVEAAQVGLPEFNQRYKGWNEERKAAWELARWQVWHEYRLSPYIKSEHKPKSPLDILRFEGESIPLDSVTPDDCHISTEQATALVELYKDFKSRQVN